LNKRGRTIVAIILSLGASVSIILLIIETILHTGPITSQEATVVSTTLGAVIGAVAVFLGGHSIDQEKGNADQESTGRMEVWPSRESLQAEVESSDTDASNKGE